MKETGYGLEEIERPQASRGGLLTREGQDGDAELVHVYRAYEGQPRDNGGELGQPNHLGRDREHPWSLILVSKVL